MSARTRSCRNCPTKIEAYPQNRTGLCRKCLDASVQTIAAGAVPSIQPAADAVQHDRDTKRLRAELSTLKGRYDAAQRIIEQYQNDLEVVKQLGDSVSTFTIEPRNGNRTSEATAVMVASDWHCEEEVGAEVGGLNVYNLEIAKARATQFFQSGLRLVNMWAQDVTIPQIVLPLLGDFITGNIHGEENAEKNQLQPVHAIIFAQNLIISGIEFLLANSPYEIVCICHSGNHARTTQKTRFSAENGHSLEYLMYLHLKVHFKGNPRVTFIVPESYHSFLDIYGTTIRFHHGHAIKYGGGVGGIYIPANKAIAQWNKAKSADLDVFGHFHQRRDGGNFICNGSLIGYNGFAQSIKADFERPAQQLFLMNKKYGRTGVWPILVG